MTAAQATLYPWHREVPRLGSAEQFAALRRLLEDTGYSQERIGRELKFDRHADRASLSEIRDPHSAMMALFFDCRLTDEAVLELLPEGASALLDSLNLLVRDPAWPGTVYSPVAISPVYDFLTACDRGEHAPDGSRCALPPDVVYPAVLDTTRRFVLGLPQGPCEAMLDLGTGTGIAALRGTLEARRVWATDITSRAALFAEFNRRLNARENMTVAEGDLYAPVEGLTFDRIVIHPPYVPVKKPMYVFRDAGEDGEQILRGAVQGLPRMLRPGGHFYSLQIATDRQGEMFEDRVRQWLGPDQAEFDVLVAAHTMRTPAEFFGDTTVRREVDIRETQEVVDLLAELKTRFLIYGALYIERHDAPRQPTTTRVQTGKGFDGRHMAWLIRWQRFLHDPEQTESLLDSRPSVAPDCEVHVVSRLHQGRFRMEDFSFKTRRPLESSFRCDRWLTQLVSECDGVRTWREHISRAQAAGHVPQGIPIKESIVVLGLLVTAGILRIPDWLPPETAEIVEDDNNSGK
jgi:methylase of polypeptide subunit release factors